MFSVKKCQELKKLSELWNLLYAIYCGQSWYHHVIWIGLIDHCTAPVKVVVTPYTCTQKVHDLKSWPGYQQYQGSLWIPSVPPRICQDSTLIRPWPLTSSSLPIHNLPYALMLYIDRCFNHHKPQKKKSQLNLLQNSLSASYFNQCEKSYTDCRKILDTHTLLL